MQAASWGDDYELLFCAPADARIAVEATAVGRVIAGGGLTLCNADAPVKLPPTLGYQHH
jgi:thiamine-monophosphate kinase